MPLADRWLKTTAQLLLKFFGAPRAIRMGPISGKYRPVFVGSPAAHSGATIPGGGKPGPVADTCATLAPRPPIADLARCGGMVGDTERDGWAIRRRAGGRSHRAVSAVGIAAETRRFGHRPRIPKT
jgi:hypothetical protein